MRLSLRGVVVAAAVLGVGTAMLPAAQAAQRARAKPAKPAPPKKTQPASVPVPVPQPVQSTHLQAGDLRVDIRSVQRSPRLIGAPLLNHDDDYLVMRLHAEAPAGKTVALPIRAGFAVLTPSTPPVKYPVISMGYFQPASARPPIGTEAISVNNGGVNFTIAAEVPKTEKQFRLALQQPAAEVTLGEPQLLPANAPVKPVGRGVWQGQASKIDSGTVVYRVNPGSTGLDMLKPHHHVFVDVVLNLRNASNQPQAVTAADVVAVGSDDNESAPLGVMGDRGRTAAPVSTSTAVGSQTDAPVLHPVFDMVRTLTYTLQVYAPASEVPLPTATPVGEMAVDTAHGHLMAGREHHLAGELPQAIHEYETVVKNFPGSDEEEEAQARLADARVAQILGQKYLPLPSAQAQGRVTAGTQAAMSIENRTGMKLSVFLSGASSQVMELQPNEKKEITLSGGPYKVAAQVPSPKYLPFAGEWPISAGTQYQIYFYLEGQNPGGNNPPAAGGDGQGQ